MCKRNSEKFSEKILEKILEKMDYYINHFTVRQIVIHAIIAACIAIILSVVFLHHPKNIIVAILFAVVFSSFFCLLFLSFLKFSNESTKELEKELDKKSLKIYIETLKQEYYYFGPIPVVPNFDSNSNVISETLQILLKYGFIRYFASFYDDKIVISLRTKTGITYTPFITYDYNDNDFLEFKNDFSRDEQDEEIEE